MSSSDASVVDPDADAILEEFRFHTLKPVGVDLNVAQGTDLGGLVYVCESLAQINMVWIFALTFVQSIRRCGRVTRLLVVQCRL